MPAKPTDKQVEQEIREAFELNYERLRLEGGHALTEDIKRQALAEVLFYWKKLPDVAEHVTETEVKLSLPEQQTPKGRKFSIEGVVDIVREQDETWMYDIKTHDGDYVRSNLHMYEEQLNVYSHIWKNLREEQLDQTAIIALSFSEKLKNAIKNRNQLQIDHEFALWEPLIPIKNDETHVKEIVRDFGRVVDEIEENKFSPTTVDRLKEKEGDALFATRVCRNCDARFSCASYREYALGTAARTSSGYKKYIEDLGDDADVENWKTVNLEAAPPGEEATETVEDRSIVDTDEPPVNLQSGVIDLASLFSYIKHHPDIPHKKEPEFAPFKSLYLKLVEQIPGLPGWYVWVNGSSKKNRIVYIGQSAEGNSATLKARIKEEFQDEYVALWGTVHDSEKVRRKLDEKYEFKYSKEIARAVRKAGTTHIVWCGAEGISSKELTTIEYNLIERLDPFANSKRITYPEVYPDMLKAVETTFKKLVVSLE